MNKYWPELGKNVIGIIEEKMHPGINSNSTMPPPEST